MSWIAYLPYLYMINPPGGQCPSATERNMYIYKLPNNHLQAVYV